MKNMWLRRSCIIFQLKYKDDTDFELLFPDEYINSVAERLSLYNELGLIKKEEDLLLYEQKLIDRFGALPKPAIALLNSLRIKWQNKIKVS